MVVWPSCPLSTARKQAPTEQSAQVQFRNPKQSSPPITLRQFSVLDTAAPLSLSLALLASSSSPQLKWDGTVVIISSRENFESTCYQH